MSPDSGRMIGLIDARVPAACIRAPTQVHIGTQIIVTLRTAMWPTGGSFAEAGLPAGSRQGTESKVDRTSWHGFEVEGSCFIILLLEILDDSSTNLPAARFVKRYDWKGHRLGFSGHHAMHGRHLSGQQLLIECRCMTPCAQLLSATPSSSSSLPSRRPFL